MPRVSNEKKNLNRLTGEFLVASRFAQRGYMISLQWGTSIGYDILVFDKTGKVVFLEVKTAATYKRDLILQTKFANPQSATIPQKKRFVACVDMFDHNDEPSVYVFPARIVAKGLQYYFNSRLPNSPSLNFPLDKKPQEQGQDSNAKTVGQYINADYYLENFDIVKVKKILQ